MWPRLTAPAWESREDLGDTAWASAGNCSSCSGALADKQRSPCPQMTDQGAIKAQALRKLCSGRVVEQGTQPCSWVVCRAMASQQCAACSNLPSLTAVPCSLTAMQLTDKSAAQRHIPPARQSGSDRRWCVLPLRIPSLTDKLTPCNMHAGHTEQEGQGATPLVGVLRFGVKYLQIRTTKIFRRRLGGRTASWCAETGRCPSAGVGHVQVGFGPALLSPLSSQRNGVCACRSQTGG